VIEVEVEARLYCADRAQNSFMEAFDLRPEYKWYCRAEEVRFSTSTPVDTDYFRNLIAKSKEAKEAFWIPAVLYRGELIADPSVRIISDGNQEMFVPA